jgi:hypothetical protein
MLTNSLRRLMTSPSTTTAEVVEVNKVETESEFIDLLTRSENQAGEAARRYLVYILYIRYLLVAYPAN